MRVHWTPLAESDLDNIQAYIAEGDAVAAIRTVLTIIHRVESLLSTHPQLGKTGRVPETRELILTGTPYIVAYEVAKGKINILAVIHSAMQWPDSFD